MKPPIDEDVETIAQTRDAARALAEALGQEYTPRVACGALIWAAAECAIDHGMNIRDFVGVFGHVLSNVSQQDLVIRISPAGDAPPKVKPWLDA